MPEFPLRNAKARLSKLLGRVPWGDGVAVTMGNTPVEPKAPRRRGVLKGRISITPAFFVALPASEISAWGEE